MSRKSRGTAREHAAIEALENLGYEVIRSTVSHGSFDCCAAGPAGIRLVQVKSRESGVRPGEVQAAKEAMADLPSGVCTVSKEVWCYRKEGHRWVLTIVPA